MGPLSYLVNITGVPITLSVGFEIDNLSTVLYMGLINKG